MKTKRVHQIDFGSCVCAHRSCDQGSTGAAEKLARATNADGGSL